MLLSNAFVAAPPGTLYGRCNFDQPKAKRHGSKKSRRPTQAKLTAVAKTEAKPASAESDPAPLDEPQVLFPVLHCLDFLGNDGAPAWVALCAVCTIRLHSKMLCKGLRGVDPHVVVAVSVLGLGG